jgi:two-component system alkaline phosphatase synthesis response regulator PhoP
VTAKILLVEADNRLAESMSRLLHIEGLQTERAAEGESGCEKALTGAYDLIILGTLLSGKSGPAICDELRRKGIDTSVLVLLARSRAEERVQALKVGADDCVSRSCDASELMARIEALLRRAPRMRRSPVSVLRFGDVEIDFAGAIASKAGRPLTMAAKEFRLLQYLADHRDRVVTRKEILKNVWEYDSAVSSRTVDVHIGWLRQKLEDCPQEPRYIRTIRSRGYRFDPDHPKILTSVASN